jgi:hypothetical protein
MTLLKEKPAKPFIPIKELIVSFCRIRERFYFLNEQALYRAK